MVELRKKVREATKAIREVSSLKPKIGIVLGTGLGGLARKIKVKAKIYYEDIPHFPLSTLEAHAGELILGTLSNKLVVALSGRFHAYEGYSLKEVTFPIRVAKALGIKTLIVSNACGGLNPAFRAGDLMVIDDHINMMGDNPLIGRNDETLGPRFPDMSEPYDRGLVRGVSCVSRSLPGNPGRIPIYEDHRRRCRRDEYGSRGHRRRSRGPESFGFFRRHR